MQKDPNQNILEEVVKQIKESDKKNELVEKIEKIDVEDPSDSESEREMEKALEVLNKKYEESSQFEEEISKKEIDDEDSDEDGYSTNINIKMLQINKKINESYHLRGGGSGAKEKDDSSISQDNTLPSNPIKDFIKNINEKRTIDQDDSLKPFYNRLKDRVDKFKATLLKIEENEGFFQFTRGFETMGFIIKENGIYFKEYAPGAKSLTLFGDFNNWNRDQYPCEKDKYGFWTIFLPNDVEGKPIIKHNTKVKINLKLPNGKREDRNPVWIKYLVQNKDNFLYTGVFWNPEPLEKYIFKNPRPVKPKSLRIYEAHVGMSSTEPRVSTYREFADNVLPRIKNTGYTAVQLMAIMEHVYYGSFGYHVTNFFAISSRSGSPEDLKYLIDKAHELGIYVLMDIIHSHASKNVLDGMNFFDGTDHLYFHGGDRGFHKQWDSKVFNYSNYETLRFLLSNVTWYMEEYMFDGFRFDGVTSMLYKNHGINYNFSGGLKEYFSDNVDIDGAVYLMITNFLAHSIFQDSITIAEDVSGMPTLCRPIEEGGYGFDYRLNMGIPDKWIQMVKELKDENWNMGNIVHTLTNRRYNEKHVGYSESHDQSIVGDKTLAMWLFDKEIYDNMSVSKNSSIVIDRGMSLHKMIRLITYSLGGEAYLNFMGNEFGHPEWVDFPREGNHFSYHYCRRRWDLADNSSLRYSQLLNFDRAMHKLESTIGWLNAKNQYINFHEKDKLIMYERGDLLFVFNFHPTQSFDHYRVGTRWGSDHIILLETDDISFGGKERLKYGRTNFFPYHNQKWNNRNNYIQIYIPCRTAFVMIAEENIDKYDLSEYLDKDLLLSRKIKK